MSPYAMGQYDDIADLISDGTIYEFPNFLPRFISDEADFANIGRKLKGSLSFIVSTAVSKKPQETCNVEFQFIARAAKENRSGSR